MPQHLTIPERLDWLLKQRGVSQNALARIAKVSPQTIANTLHHGRVPQARTTQRWARALGVPNSFFATTPMSEDQLLAVIERAPAFEVAAPRAKGTRTTTSRKATTVTTTTGSATKPSTTKKATTAKKTAAKKAAATKPVAKKATTAARKPATAKKVTAAKKATTATKPVAKKPVAKKATTTRATSAKVVRHGAAKRTAATGAGRSNGAGIGIDREALLKKLVKLTNSKQDAVALDATKTLLTFVK